MNTTTPMMKQWKNLKDKAKDALLLFRLGDFYEAFYDDCFIIAKELDLTLTKRQQVPMCGIPHYTYESYVDRLIAKGYKVAIAEQIEDPKKAKGIVERDITQILSPGVTFSSGILKEKANNYFLCLSQISLTYGLAVIDLSTNEFFTLEIEDKKDFLDEVLKIKPSEILVSRKFKAQNAALLNKLKLDFSFLLNERDEWYFDFELAHEKLLAHFQITTLDSLGLKAMPGAITSAGALLTYLTEDLSFNLSHIKTLKKENLSSFMGIDYSSMKNLEILEPISHSSSENTLLTLLDKTATAMGGRLLRKWLKNPLLDIAKIIARQNAISEILDNFETFINVRSYLENIKDLQRLLIKIANHSANPKDLASLKISIRNVPYIKNLMQNCKSEKLYDIKENLKDISPLLNLLEDTIVDSPPLRLSEGDVFKKGYCQKLDELKEICSNSQLWLNRYQNDLKESTGIKTLKVKYNKIFGYFIEITRSQIDKIPENFIRKQTLVNCERYITPELKEFEYKALSAEEKIKTLEIELFFKLKEEILQYSADIEKISAAIGKLDTLLALGINAKKFKYIKPEINDSGIIDIKNARHPVVEGFSSLGQFIPNDIYLDSDKNQLLLITGPNMAGKSTYIRQTALIIIMAQLGSYIPAESAKIGIVDKVFSRVGASDDLARGQSTFMVEMIETANILHNATNRSLVILDEIGRGTSTYDGISIAWAVAEYLVSCTDKKAKTLFATHYFELTNLEKELKGIVNYNIAIKEVDGQIVFLRKIIKGSADKSYGIHVAELANMPSWVIQKAKQRLSMLEKNETISPLKKYKPQQLNFFDAYKKDDSHQKIINEIKNIDINSITPIEALQKIFSLKQKIDTNKINP